VIRVLLAGVGAFFRFAIVARPRKIVYLRRGVEPYDGVRWAMDLGGRFVVELCRRDVDNRRRRLLCRG
jgi:hypothetical protein